MIDSFDTSEILAQPFVSVALLWKLWSDRLARYIGNPHEARAIVQRLLSYYLRLEAMDFIWDVPYAIPTDIQQKLLYAFNRLQRHEPIQYVIGTADFIDNSFKVTPAVLIPRPETAEWVSFLIENIVYPDSILDIGTGSGCVAITLKKHFSQSIVDAIDISQAALAVAWENAHQMGVAVNFIQMDILTTPLPLSKWSLMVSNPPYVRMQEKPFMAPNVLDYEPTEALFVADDDPLIFYRRIIAFACSHLHANGTLCLEINEAFGEAIMSLLAGAGFRNRSLHQDLHAKDRWVVACW